MTKMTDDDRLVLSPTTTANDTMDDASLPIDPSTPSTSDHEASAKIVFLSVNDVYDMVPNAHGHGGIAEFATLLDQQKALLPSNVTLLVTLNGDFLSGSEMAERFKGCVASSS